MRVYRVKRWEKLFETSETRKLKRLHFVPVPNKHDGRGYQRLMKKPNGLGLYAAWHLILQVASRCPLRGVLADDDGPLSAEDVADKTSTPQFLDVIREALDVLSDPRIGWLTYDDEAEKSAGVPADPRPEPNRPEPNRTEPTGTEGKGKTGPEADGAFAKLSDRDGSGKFNIHDPMQVFDWCAKHRALVGSAELDLLHVLGARERALEVGKKPVALFVALVDEGVRKQDWSKLSGEQMDRARAVYRELREKVSKRKGA